MNFDLGRIAELVAPNPACAGTMVTGWSTDSRSAVPGDLFFAIRGPNHDGHLYLNEIFEKGAVAAVVETGRASSAGICLETPDVLAALERIAAWARLQWNGTVVAITGSAGKTTTKETIWQLLSTAMPVGKTEGNLNNHIGMPLSLLRVPQEVRVAVIEIGMNHPGEIRKLAAVARPQIGVVTNVGKAHAEFFDTPDGVALAKRELIESLPPDGTAVLNQDDEKVARFRDIHPGPVVTFGTSPSADVKPEQVVFTSDGISFRLGGIEFECSLVGRHSLLNVLAGIAVAGVFGIGPERLRDAVRSLAPGKMRGERLVHAGITIFNDCYNSNPEASRSMLDVLRATPARRRIAVLGEMLELGQWSEPLHRDVGEYVVQCGVDVLVGIRGAARRMVDQAIRSGLPADAALFFDDPAEAGEYLRGILKEGDAVLFKGSRGTHVERALDRVIVS